ncbi:MAG: hypothetical protein HC915_12430 [Anaerolineae bacterium]|nr:hypothetical protein [Anaerolineae bacterium]
MAWRGGVALLLALLWARPTAAQLPATVRIAPENAAQVVELAQLGQGQVHFLSWAPGGNGLVVSSSTGRLSL